MAMVGIPKTWESLLDSSFYLPVIVQTIEKFHDANWSMQPNKHDYFEMVYMKKGYAAFEISGLSTDIGPNDIIIIKPHEEHKFIIKSETGCEFIVLYFDFINKMQQEFSEVPLHDFLNFVSGKKSGPFIQLKVSQKNDIIVLLNKIIREKANTELGSEFLNQLFVLELFVHISRALKMEWEDSIKGKSHKLNELIDVAVKYMKNNFERGISVNDVARYVFLSQSYFTRAFREITGMSPLNYLLKLRVERSKELLTDTEMKVCDIALNVGFSNQQRFNEIFKKHTSLAPLMYRKQKTLRNS